jgi:hypothetical protein
MYESGSIRRRKVQRLLAPIFRDLRAASAGAMLLILTAFFYIPILATEIQSSLAMEGINYVGDTLRFVATALLAGFGVTKPGIPESRGDCETHHLG